MWEIFNFEPVKVRFKVREDGWACVSFFVLFKSNVCILFSHVNVGLKIGFVT